MSYIGGDIGSYDEDDDDLFPCKYCKVPVYWGDHYDPKGAPDRRLFTASNKRLHDCGAKLDPDSFAAVPEA